MSEQDFRVVLLPKHHRPWREGVRDFEWHVCLLGSRVWGLVALERELAPQVLGTDSPRGTEVVAVCQLWILPANTLPASPGIAMETWTKPFSPCSALLGVFPPGLQAYKSFFPACRSGGSPGPCLGRVTDKSIWSDSCLCCFPSETSSLFGFLVNWVWAGTGTRKAEEGIPRGPSFFQETPRERWESKPPGLNRELEICWDGAGDIIPILQMTPRHQGAELLYPKPQDLSGRTRTPLEVLALSMPLLLLLKAREKWKWPLSDLGISLLVMGKEKANVAHLRLMLPKEPSGNLFSQELVTNLQMTWPRTLGCPQMQPGLPRWLSCKESANQCRKQRGCRFKSWVGNIPWSRKWQLTPVFLPGEFHGQRSLAGYSPRGRKDTDTKEQVTLTAQYVCQEYWCFVKLQFSFFICKYTGLWYEIYFLLKVTGKSV